MKDFIPVNEPVLSREAKANVMEALETVWISSSGGFVRKFEEQFAEYLGVEYAVAVSSGTAALHIALLSLEIGPGDEVIVPAFTMGASWLAVLYVGAKPVFVDCTPDTFNVDTSKIEDVITSNTRAIMPVHIYGHPADMDKIEEIAKKHGLKVIEDAAEAHGAEYKGRKAGSMGDINAFSFYANKLITCGEGGMVVTNDEKLARLASKYKNLFHSDEKRFIHKGVGFNYRMTNLQAGLGLGELQHLDEYIDKKTKMAEYYDTELSKIPGIRRPVVKKDVKSVFWMYALLVDKKEFGESKDKLREDLEESGIETRDFFYPPTSQPVLKEYLSKKDTFPVASRIAKEGLYLPSGLALTERQMAKVTSEVQRIFKN